MSPPSDTGNLIWSAMADARALVTRALCSYAFLIILIPMVY